MRPVRTAAQNSCGRSSPRRHLLSRNVSSSLHASNLLRSPLALLVGFAFAYVAYLVRTNVKALRFVAIAAAVWLVFVIAGHLRAHLGLPIGVPSLAILLLLAAASTLAIAMLARRYRATLRLALST